jgi:hypothetical protein
MKRVIELFSYIILGIIILMVFVGLLTMLGCAVAGPPAPEVEPISQTTQVVWKTINSTDWLSTGFMVAVALGVFAGLNGIKAGFLAALAALSGLVLKSALSVPWVYSALAVGLVGVLAAGGLLMVASILRKNRSLEQVIKGTQAIKALIPECPDVAPVNKVLSNIQDRTTKALVLNTKTKLKLRGDL